MYYNISQPSYNNSQQSIQQPAPQTSIAEDRYISLYVSKNRVVGYSIDNSTQSEADYNALAQCQQQIRSKKDECLKVVAGPGKCLGISRASNGAVGASIGDNRSNVGSEAQVSCKTNGGKDCSFPYDTLFCIQ
jgi:hypothetical protein